MKEDSRKKFHNVINNCIPESACQRCLPVAEFSTDFILSLRQFLTKPRASICHRATPCMALFRDDVRDSYVDEDSNSVLIKGLREDKGIFITKTL